MRKVNLLYVITKLELGGAQKQLLGLINYLEKKRFNIFLFTAYEGLLMSEALSIDYLKVKRSKFLERPISPLKDFFALIEIYRFIKENGIDIVHTHSSKAGILGRWAARLANVPIIIHTIHGWPFHQWQNVFARQFYVFLERKSADISSKLIAVSEYDIKKGLKYKIGEKDKYVLIRYGIDKGLLREYNNYESARNASAPGAQEAVVGMVACLKPQKSPQDYVKAAALVAQELPNIKFILIGDGILRGKIERLVKKLNLDRRFILMGWRRDIPHILSGIDIFVLTSLWEGLPIAVLEALTLKKPVVATDTGGITEIVKDRENGFIVPPKNVKILAQRLISLLKDKPLRLRMSKGMEDNTDSEFTYEHIVNKTQGLYVSLIRIINYVV